MFAAPKWPTRQIFGGHLLSNCANPAMARSRSDTAFVLNTLHIRSTENKTKEKTELNMLMCLCIKDQISNTHGHDFLCLHLMLNY